MRPTALFYLYQAVTYLALPFVARHAVNTLRRAGVDVDRAHERLGHATAQRRAGHLIWFHGANVAEATSILPLMTRIAAGHPDATLLLTSSTATSAQAVEERLPDGAVHQFSPLDGTGPMRRFLRRWRPDLCVLVDSDLWPTLLDQCAGARIPVALVNARMSDNGAQGWKRFPGTAAYVLRGIEMAHCQDRRSRDHLRDMGLAMAERGANLNAMIGAPPIARDVVDAAHDALNGRPVWVAATPHPDEEKAVLAAHATLLAQHPNLCLILVPHNPERVGKTMELIRKAGLSVAQRSAGGALSDGAQVYLADTMGEAGLWYALSPIVFLGNAFTDADGPTPFQPAAAHTAILHGPKHNALSEVYAAFRIKDASIEVPDISALAAEIDTLLTHPSRAAQLAANARGLAQGGEVALGDLAKRLFSLAHAHAMGAP